MFKKTRVRQIIELLQKNLSDREISNVLGVSRNACQSKLMLFVMLHPNNAKCHK